ncbi:MAG: sensor histidine kinase [Gemmatimonadaceae bacterium]
MNDSLAQTYIVAITIHLAGVGIGFYLWTENRAERFLQFWTLAWTAGLVRWLLHYPATFTPPLRAIEVLFISATMFFMVLGSYDLIPGKPWKQKFVVGATALVLFAYGVAANLVAMPLELGYALFAAVLAFVSGCMWVAYRSTRLPGYVFAAVICLCQLVLVGVMLVERGAEIANSIIIPLYNIPLILSIVVIAHQRDRRQLRASASEMRQLYMRLANVEDDERRALHAELHDQVGANLSALRLELDVAASLLSRNDASSAERHLGSARVVAVETIARARDLMAGLRAPALDDFGLVAALRNLAESQSSRLNLRIDVAGDDVTPRPGRLVESSLFRIAQEAVMNAARHASATRVTVAIVELDGRVTLTVRDDGVGFDLDAPGTDADHWGLKSMHERARAIGGMLHVESALGAGTRVTAEVPREAT